MSTTADVCMSLIFYVNGKKVIENNPDPEWTLLYYLRKKLFLYGSKQGCSEGGCGACTVMVSKYDRRKDRIIHLSVNACLAPVCSMHGLAVTTVEGIGSTKTHLHPVQERIAKAHGSQCGFCTPGIVMSMYTLLRNMPKPSYSDIEITFQGNLCRCTGYRPILEGYKTFVEDWEHSRISTTNGTSNGVCGLGDKCCKNGGSKVCDEPQDTFKSSEFTPHDPTQEPIFPPELKLSSLYEKQTLVFKGPTVTWHRPTTLDEILKLKKEHNDARIVTGNTEVGLEMKFKNLHYPVIIMPNQVPELTAMIASETGLTVGANVTLSDMEVEMNNLIRDLPIYKTRVMQTIVDMLHWFSGKQIRNVATLGGNIMTGSPISDLNPILMASGATLKFRGTEGDEDMVMDDTFFTGYRKNRSNPNHVLVWIHIPYTSENGHFKAYKQAKRREDDIAIVNMALKVNIESDLRISSMKLAFGGMAPITVMAKKTCQKLKGEKWTEDILQKVFDCLIEDLPLSPSAPGGMVQYRRSLTLSLFFKAFLEVSSEINCNIGERNSSGIGGFKHKVLKSSQYFNISENEIETDPIGKPIVHVSAIKQATGEAVYCDDMSAIEGELYLAPVISSRAHATIISIDASEAVSIEGVKSFFSAKDLLPERNRMGPIIQDEEIFASTKVQYFGQIVGATVATDPNLARKAAKAVKIVYEDIEPVILTIAQAIEAKSYLDGPIKITKGEDIEVSFKQADNIIEDTLYIGGQEHFYIEPQTARALPKKEDDELEIYATCQHPSMLNKLVADVLGIPVNRVVTKVKRIGGGFGGKEVQNMMIALPVAVAAHKMQVPVRCALERDDDMIITGGRHPFFAKYKIAFTNDGKITGLKVEMYVNGGYSADVSIAELERTMTHCENSYNIPNIDLVGFICKTNLQTNTAIRATGGPQGMLLAETYMRRIAETLKLPYHEVASKNLYKEGDITHYRQILSHCTLTRCWEECISKANYLHRKDLVEEYNRQNRWKKRGLSIVPTKFGVAFTSKCLNQAGALVHVYLDGSVLLTHGGIEMGQGLHTKMIQVASRVLEIDQSKIYISETSTDKVPNTSPTAASVSSDLNGMAVINACKQIMERLEPVRMKHPHAKWETLIHHAYFECISLSAVGYYSNTSIDYNVHKNEGTPYNYFTYGVACSEVEIDCLTGDHQVLRTDIVMDVGESLNPAIDVGQIEGAFMQGYGLFMMEELIYSPKGELYSKGPSTYKIPGFSDIPGEFNVSLLKGASNPRAIYSSKAVGEPPLFLASSVFFAIREAIVAARKETGASTLFKFDSPATAARIRMACEDHITAKFPDPPEGSYEPWNIRP